MRMMGPPDRIDPNREGGRVRCDLAQPELCRLRLAGSMRHATIAFCLQRNFFALQLSAITAIK